MKLAKKFLISTILILSCAFTFAQADVEEVETSVESDYLNDMIAETIAAMAESPELSTKLEAVSFLRNQVENGNTSPSIIKSLDRLAGEGITTEERKEGRIMNNFPEVRREACLILGNVPTVHSKNTLVQIAKEDLEPMVGAAAIKSLGDIAVEVGCVDEACEAIRFFQNHNMYMNPTSSFAYEVLVAYEKLIDHASPTEKKYILQSIAEILGNANYHNNLVEAKAMNMLMEYSGMNKMNNKNNGSVSEK